MGTLYRLTSPAGKSYIGISSKSTADRWAKHVEHANGKRNSGALYAALRKYGHESFKVETLAVGDWGYLIELEKRAIAAFGTKSPGGYNITDGGEGTVGRVISAAQRENISDGQKRRYERPEEVQRAIGIMEYGRAVRLGVVLTPKGWKKHPKAPTFSWKLAHSLATREAMARPEVAEKVRECAKQRAADPVWRERMSAAKKGKKTVPCSEERKAKIAEARRREWQDPVIRAKRLEALKRAREKKQQTR